MPSQLVTPLCRIHWSTNSSGLVREIGRYLTPHGFARAHPVGPVRVLGGGSDEAALRGCEVEVVRMAASFLAGELFIPLWEAVCIHSHKL